MPNLYVKGTLYWQGTFDEQRALYHLAKNEYADAIECFNKAIAVSPNNFYFYEGRAYAYTRTGEYTAALADIERYLACFQISGSHPTGLQGSESILFPKSYCLAESNQLEEALLAIEEHLTKRRFNKRASYLAAIIECRLGLYSRAIDRLNTALGKEEGDFPHLYLTREKNSALNLLEQLKSGVLNHSILSKDNFPIKYYYYYYINMPSRISEGYSYVTRMMSHNEQEHLGTHSYAYQEARMCNRCQMSPCHCSDPDLD